MQKPIRILHVVQRMEAAGVQNLLMNIYRNIDRTKVQFDFLVHYEEKQFFDDEIESLGGKIYRLSFREDLNLFKYFRDLDIFFKKHKEYKIVHGHMHSLGAIYLFFAKKNGVPIRIAHAHTNSTQNDYKKYLKLIMNKYYAKYATDLFACSTDAGNYLFGDKKFKVVNNSIDSNRFVFSEEKRIKKRLELGLENKIVIGNIARFEKQKNHSFIIDIFKELHDLKKKSVLVLIGTGSMEEFIKEKVKKLGLTDSVIFLKNRKDIPELLMTMDVFLFPSLFEGLGIVAIESQASGIPTLCSDGIPEEVNISPLNKKLSLSETPLVWAKTAIEFLDAPYTHTNTQNYVIESGFDIRQTAREIQDFYLKSFSASC